MKELIIPQDVRSSIMTLDKLSKAPFIPLSKDSYESKRVLVNMGHLPHESLGFNPLKALGQLIKRFFDELLSFISGVLKGIESATRKVVKAAIDFVKTVFKAIIAIATDFSFDTIIEEFGKMGRSFGNLLVVANPVSFSLNVLRKVPLANSMIKEFDRFSGGALQTVENINTLFGRVIRGDSISKQELMTYAILGIQVAAIFFAPTVAAQASGYAGLIANQLKQGTLGKTAFGRDLLGFIAVAGSAYAVGSGIYSATEQYAMDVANKEAMELATSTLGLDSKFEFFLFNAVAMAGAGYYATGSMDGVVDVVSDFSYDEAKKEIKEDLVQELTRHIPSKYAGKLAGFILERAENTDLTSIDLTMMDKSIFDDMYSFDDFLRDMENAGASIMKVFQGEFDFEVKMTWPDMDRFQDFVNREASRVSAEVMRTPENINAVLENAADKGAELVGKLVDAVMDAKVSVPDMPELKFPDLKIPDITAPDLKFDPDFSKVWKLWKMYDQYFNGKRAMYRTEHGGYVIYLLEDGTYYYYRTQNNNWLWLVAAAGAAITLT